MEGENKIKNQLINEPAGICQQISELEGLETRRKRAEKELELERSQLLSLFEYVNEVIYIADQKTYEILYANKALQDLLQKNPLGSICYREIWGLESPCKFCLKEVILKGKEKSYRWEYHSPVLNMDFIIFNKIIKWHDGRDAIFASAINITEHRRAEEALKRRLEFEETVARISSRFVGVSDIDEAINASLAETGNLTGADRAYLFLLREDRATMDNTHEWCAEGVSSQIDNLQNLPCEIFPWSVKKLRQREVIHIEDVSSLPAEAKAEKEILEMQDIKSLLILPVYIGKELAGFIGFDDVTETGKWCADDLALLRMSSDIIGNALERQGTEEALRRSEEKYRSLIENSKDVIYIASQDGDILEVNPAGIELFGYSKEELLSMKVRDLCANLADLRKFVSEIENQGFLKDYPFDFKKKDGKIINTLITATVCRNNNGSVEYEGIIRNITEKKQAEEELRQSLEKLRITMKETIQAVALMAEIRDPYTAGHQQRVARLARAIAREMCLSVEQVDTIEMAAIIHDIGKMYVPAEILNKPGRISETEFNLIKAHPQVGYDILKTIEFPWPIARIVLQHHERMDGSGYPAGLSGKDILLEARILAVADVVEAMASHRPYRPALGLDRALEEISQYKNVLYDPGVVEACLKLFTEKGFNFK